MAILYRTDGAWGSGKGTNLVPAEVDENFYDVDQRIEYLQDNPPEAITPIAINIEGGLFTMTMSDGSTLGPIAMTMPVPQWRGDWQPSTPYLEMDFFVAPDGGMGAVMQSHTSAATFDWAALSGGLPVYQEIVGASGTTAGLGDLVDVAVSGSADGDFLIYNLAASLWQNRSKATVATTVLPAFGGDAGAGGTQGMVPAPAAGDSAAGKVLGASGTWVVPAGGTGGSSSLAGLSDVAISAPANNSLLQYASADGLWHNRTLTALGAGSVTSVDAADGVTTGGSPITATGTIRLSQIDTLNLLANITGANAAPSGVSLSSLLDAVLGTSRGSLLRRGVSGWTALAPGSAGSYLKSGGAGADVSWDNPAGTGTVTSIASGTGLTGGPITSTGTLSLGTIANDTILANITGGSAAPSATTLSGLLDHILGSGRGQIIYRGGSTWSALSPGTNGYYLQTRGAGNDPIWSNVKGGGGGATAPPSLWHNAVDYATAAPLPAHSYANGSAGVGATLTASANGALTIDGATVTVGQRILVKDESLLNRNGCYTVTAAGSGAAPWVLTRATDYDEPSEITQGTAFPVTLGTVNDATAWVMITAGTLIIGTSAVEFDPITATMPIAAAGEIIGNPNSFAAPALPASLSSIIDRAISSTQGAVLYRGASAWAALAPGTAGYVLTTAGAAANPSWAAPSGGTSLPSGTTHDQLVYVSGAWSAQRPRYVVSCFVPGVPIASQLLLLQRLSKGITIPANFGAYLGHTSMARGTVNATASTAIDVSKATSAAPGTWSSVGTITIAAGAQVGTFTSVGGTAITFAQGDSIRLVAPGTPDTTFADFAASLVGYET